MTAHDLILSAGSDSTQVLMRTCFLCSIYTHYFLAHKKKTIFLQKLTFLGLVSGSKQGTMLNLSDSSGTENVKSNLSVNFNIH